MKVLICDSIKDEALQPAVEYLKNNQIETIYQPDITSDELKQAISQYDGLILRSRTKVTSELLSTSSTLKIIGRVGTGTDNIDKNVAVEKNIIVTNAPGANAQAVAELTIGLILELYRKLNIADASVREGKWLKKELVGNEINGKTVGIIGYGMIGKKVGTLINSFGTTLLTHDRNNDLENLNELLKKSDIITLHMNLFDETKNFMNKEKLSLMKNNAILINCARAGLIVEDDLFEVLTTNKIRGAALDVYWNEPITSDNRWIKLDNVVFTPHIGAQTIEALSNAIMIVANDFVAFNSGQTVIHTVQ